MSVAPARLVIATRQSRLALWQSEHVQAALAKLHPACAVELLAMSTRGDQILDRSLAAIGGKGLFIKELEVAMSEGRADLAVHSCKDVPMDLPEGFVLGAIGVREDPRDAFIANRYDRPEALPAGAIVGTSSLRREAQLRARFPGLAVLPLRGNVQTRLRKLDDGEFDAIILAAAGLKRLGLGERISAFLSPEESLPAPGQGALGIECLAARADLVEAMAPLMDVSTARAVEAERTVSRLLGGSCQVPLGAYGECAGASLRLRGFVATPDGSRMLAAEVRGAAEAAATLGAELAAQLRSRGADALLSMLDTNG